MIRRVVHAVPSDGAAHSRIGDLGLNPQGLPDQRTIDLLYDERDFQRACQPYFDASWKLPDIEGLWEAA